MAEIVPAKLVCLSDHTTTLPPVPLAVAFALIVLLASILTVRACGSGPVPWRPPPICTVPPPVAPEASSVAAFSAICCPVTVIAPPLPVGLLASSRPETCTDPPAPPESTMLSEVPDRLVASITPDMLMAWRAMFCAVAADSCTLPPGAETVPLFLTSAPLP